VLVPHAPKVACQDTLLGHTTLQQRNLPGLASVPQLRLACWPNGFSWSSVKIVTAVTPHEEDVISIPHNPIAMHGGLVHGSCGLACPLCPAAPGLPLQETHQVQIQCHGRFHRNGRNRLYEEAIINKWADAWHYTEVFMHAPYVWQDVAQCSPQAAVKVSANDGTDTARLMHGIILNA